MPKAVHGEVEVLKDRHTHTHEPIRITLGADLTTDVILLRVTYNDTKHFLLSPGSACFTFDPIRYFVIRG